MLASKGALERQRHVVVHVVFPHGHVVHVVVFAGPKQKADEELFEDWRWFLVVPSKFVM